MIECDATQLLTPHDQGAISVCYIVLHNLTAYLISRPQSERTANMRTAVQLLATISLRVGVTAWLAACGLNVTFTIARQASCAPNGDSATTEVDDINTGVACILQRTGVGASLMCL